MGKSRGIWPDQWRRGRNLSDRLKNKRNGERLIMGVTLLSLTAGLALQIMGGEQNPSAKPAVAAAIMAAAPGVSAASANPVNPQEQALWDKALESRTRQGFEDYQNTFPAGLYAAKAQQALATCRAQTRQRWKPNPSGGVAQSERGAAAVADGLDQTQACASARSAALLHAQQSCSAASKGAAPNATLRNSVDVTGEAACACAPSADGGTLCVTELQTACRWEERVTRTVEVCGG